MSGAGEKGFTLLELLVSLTLLSLLTVALVAALRFGVASWRKSQDASVRLHAIALAQKEIASDLSRIYPKFIDHPPDAAFVDFDGRETQIRFYTPDPRSGFLLNTLLGAVGTAPSLSLQIEAMPDIATSGRPASRVLLDGLSSVAFAYYGQADGEREAGWHSSWQGQSALPKLIRVRMTSASGRMPIPEAVISPRIDADVGCVFDPSINFCRGRK